MGSKSSFTSGAAVVLPNSRIAIVIKDQVILGSNKEYKHFVNSFATLLKVWYYKIINNQIYKDSENNGPNQVNKTVEDFPDGISASLTLDFNVYYFFRGRKYRKRPLIVGDNSIIGINQTEWEETYEIDENGNRRLLNRTEVRPHLRQSIFCICQLPVV